ncbi:hypothetical protein BH10CYA1_BH10CYA1_43420 [soil metagenome]
MNWVGLTVEQFAIDALIGEGSFAWIFRGVSESGDRRAFKVAKPKDFILKGMRTGVVCTKAIKFRTNGIGEAVPDSQELLGLEYKKLGNLNLPCLPKYFSQLNREGLGYLQMELLEGHTLFQEIETGKAALSFVKKTAQALNSLIASGLAYHGDLNPENIFIVGGEVKILDPGHFGELKLADGVTRGVFVTTPQYYPLLKPDDVLALGLTAWQAVVGKPLIERELRDSVADSGVLAPETLSWIEAMENMGNFYISGLRSLTLPRASGLTFEQEAVLLRSVRLALNQEGKIVRDPGYASAAAFADSLKVFA